MIKTRITLTLCFLCLQAQGAPQDDDPRQTRYDKIMEDSSSVDLTMRMDRLEYLPGEGATISLIVKNNMNEPLEILKPFSDLNYFTPYTAKGCVDWLDSFRTPKNSE